MCYSSCAGWGGAQREELVCPSPPLPAAAPPPAGVLLRKHLVENVNGVLRLARYEWALSGRRVEEGPGQDQACSFIL